MTEYSARVSGEAAIDTNVVSDLSAGIRDVVGGDTFDYEEKGEGMPWANFSGTAVETRSP